MYDQGGWTQWQLAGAPAAARLSQQARLHAPSPEDDRAAAPWRVHDARHGPVCQCVAGIRVRSRGEAVRRACYAGRAGRRGRATSTRGCAVGRGAARRPGRWPAASCCEVAVGVRPVETRATACRVRRVSERRCDDACVALGYAKEVVVPRCSCCREALPKYRSNINQSARRRTSLPDRRTFLPWPERLT